MPRLSARILSDGSYVAAGQALSAVGTVAGIRVLTELVTPETFGTVTLAVGVAALAINVACTPITQAGLHFYPAFASSGTAGTLISGLWRAVRRAGAWVSVMLLLGGLAWTLLDDGSAAVVAVVAGLIAVDAARAVELTMMNARRQHGRYAAWWAAEAWGRPLLASLLVWQAGDDPLYVLGAYLVASVLLFGMFRARPASPEASADPGLDGRIWTYAMPLVPLGVIGWVNGLGDRYIIGNVLSLADAGVYAATYGLVSRPFLMLGQSVELTIRPIYQEAVMAGDGRRADRLLLAWFAAVVAAGLVGVAVVTVASEWLAFLLLGPAFRSGASLMPWIAGGYALIIVAHVFERVCFAYGQTRWVLVIQASAAAVGMIGTAVGTVGWGLQGAAWAVPLYFAVQLVVSAYAARDTRRRAGKVAWGHASS